MFGPSVSDIQPVLNNGVKHEIVFNCNVNIIVYSKHTLSKKLQTVCTTREVYEWYRQSVPPEKYFFSLNDVSVKLAE